MIDIVISEVMRRDPDLPRNNTMGEAIMRSWLLTDAYRRLLDAGMKFIYRGALSWRNHGPNTPLWVWHQISIEESDLPVVTVMCHRVDNPEGVDAKLFLDPLDRRTRSRIGIKLDGPEDWELLMSNQ